MVGLTAGILMTDIDGGEARMKGARYRFVVVFDSEEDGRVIASAPGIPGGHVYGKTRAEALRRLRAALRFYVRQALGKGRAPRPQSRAVAEIEVVA